MSKKDEIIVLKRADPELKLSMIAETAGTTVAYVDIALHRARKEGLIPHKVSKTDKVRSIVGEHFPAGWFTSKEVQLIYEREVKDISVSEISTYLTRLVDRGILLKQRSSRGRNPCIYSIPLAQKDSEPRKQRLR